MSVMKKTVLFGAGLGATQYIANFQHERDFIAIFDNDENKHGSAVSGIPIKHPNEILTTDFEELVIVSQYVKDIKRQLLEDIGLPETRIVTPQKNKLKNPRPFENPNSMSLAREIVCVFNQMAIEASYPLSLDFGTLLGIVRDKDIIAWDDDIDFAAPVNTEDRAFSLCEQFIEKQSNNLRWKAEKIFNNQGVCTCILLTFESNNEDYKSFITSICFREEKENKSLHLPSLGMWYSPALHFQTLETIDWNGQTLQVPAKYKEYLSFLYGDWQTPKKDIQFDDYANLQSVSMDEIKEQ